MFHAMRDDNEFTFLDDLIAVSEPNEEAAPVHEEQLVMVLTKCPSSFALKLFKPDLHMLVWP